MLINILYISSVAVLVILTITPNSKVVAIRMKRVCGALFFFCLLFTVLGAYPFIAQNKEFFAELAELVLQL